MKSQSRSKSSLSNTSEISGLATKKAEIYITPIKERRQSSSSSPESFDDIPHDDAPLAKPLTMTSPGMQLIKLNSKSNPHRTEGNSAEQLLVNLNKLKELKSN